MKNIFALSALSLAFASSAFAGSSYVTGNVQFHDDGRIHGSDVTSTLEAGHTFDNQFGGFTVYTEFDGIQLGKLETENGGAGNTTPAITVGGEQSFNITDH
ncbi:porin, partial [Vibrio parahaemolyticus]|nr:porin [Vibrio parahaemolyticus]